MPKPRFVVQLFNPNLGGFPLMRAALMGRPLPPAANFSSIPPSWSRALVPYRPPPSAVAPYRRPPSALVPYRPPPSALVPYVGPSQSIRVPVNHTAIATIRGFASGRSFTDVTRTWWFTLLVMAGLFCLRDPDEESLSSQGEQAMEEHATALRWLDRVWAYTPRVVARGGIWAASTATGFDPQRDVPRAVAEMITPDMVFRAVLTGVDPGPYRYAFERSDPGSILRISAFFLLANESDWNELIQTVAPISSAPDMIRNVRAEFGRLVYPAAGWIAGSAMGFALPLHPGIAATALAWNVIGGAMAYAKAFDDLDRSARTHAPHIHKAIHEQMDRTIEKRRAEVQAYTHGIMGRMVQALEDDDGMGVAFHS